MTLDQFIAANPTITDPTALLALASVPTYTPRVGRITFTTIGAVLGLNAIAIRGSLIALQSSSNPQLAGFAGYAVDVLRGDGFDATDPTSVAISDMFVTAFVCSTDQARTIFNTVSYPCGTIPLLADVQAALDRAGRIKAIAVLDNGNSGRYNANSKKIMKMISDPTIVVPADQAGLDAMVTK
jgi:hypothetical protein